MSVISAEQFINRSCQEVEIHGFQEGETITVLLKRTSLMSLASSGKIPNPLMSKVVQLFNGKDAAGNPQSASDMALKEMGDVGKIMDILCEACMVSPRYEEIKEYMTDDQRSDIFGWSQTGVVDLAPTDPQP